MEVKIVTNVDLNAYYDSFSPKLRREIQEAIAKLISGNSQLRVKGPRKSSEVIPEGNWALTKKRPTRLTTKTYKLIMALERLNKDTYDGATIKKHLHEVNGGPPLGASTQLWITNMIKSGYLKVVRD